MAQVINDMIEGIIDFFKFDADDKTSPKLKYKKGDILELDDEQVTRLSTKIGDPNLKSKIEEIVVQNKVLREHIDTVIDSKTLTDESNTALTKMYLTLLRAEINIILRDLAVLSETEEVPEPKKHNIKELLDVMTKKFNAINRFLNKYSSKNGMDLNPPAANLDELPNVPAKDNEQPNVQTKDADIGTVPIPSTEGANEPKQVGGYRNDRCINYCKYIKYKIKYQNLKYNI
jgi:hypothetical protein